LRKLKELVASGATIIGPEPARSMSLENYPKQDAEVQKLARELWGKKSGRGRVIADKSAREVLLADGVKPDFEPMSPGAELHSPPGWGGGDLFRREPDQCGDRCGLRVSRHGKSARVVESGQRRTQAGGRI
jgi:hypothetical protein